MRKPRIGVALGSGGARGWCHIGALKALTEEGVEPDIVAGCSMGALVGAAYVAGKLDALEEWARALTWRKMTGFLDVSLTTGGLIEGKRIVSFLSGLQDDAPIESLAKPFTAIASDMATGREVWLQSGPVLGAVRASIALPGIISPTKLDGRWLLDGGMTNPVPVSACRAMGADIIIAINPNANVLEPHARKAMAKQDETSGALSGDMFDKMFEVAARRHPAKRQSPYAAKFEQERKPELFRRGFKLHRHHDKPDSAQPAGWRTASCHDRAAPRPHVRARIQSRGRSHRGGARQGEKGDAFAARISAIGRRDPDALHLTDLRRFRHL